jgi:HK97 family phage prohead protease
VRPDFDEVFRPHSLIIPRVTPAWVNHDPLQQVGSTEDRTFRLRCDDEGLWAELDCPHTDVGDRLLHGSRFGEFTGWSISFRATEETWDRSGARPLRIVAQANLIEVSIADRGAHVTTLGVLSRMRAQGAAP